MALYYYLEEYVGIRINRLGGASLEIIKNKWC